MKKKSLLGFIVPAFVAVAHFGIEAASIFAMIGEPKLPSKFDQ